MLRALHGADEDLLRHILEAALPVARVDNERVRLRRVPSKNFVPTKSAIPSPVTSATPISRTYPSHRTCATASAGPKLGA